MVTKVALKGIIESKLANRNNTMKFGTRVYHHLGDFSTKKTANEYVKMVKELSDAAIRFGEINYDKYSGYLVRISIPYYGHINKDAKYGVYIARKRKV